MPKIKRPKWFEKGRIIKCPLDYPYEKKKYCIILGFDFSKGEILFILINSEITKFVKSKPNLLELQVEIRKTDYPKVFSKQVSYADCTRIRKKDMNELVQEIENGKAIDCGILKTTKKEEIFNKILQNPDLKSRDRIYVKSTLPEDI